MTSAGDAYLRLHAILADARLLKGEQLDAFLERACTGDGALRAEVEELLATAQDEGRDDAFVEPRVAGARQALEELLEPEPDWVPETIGDYRIHGVLGRGGMGVVYEAEQASPHRRVAVKLLHPMHVTRERTRRFRREAALLGRLQHPGIAQIFEAGTYDLGRGPQPFFAMELVDGVDVRTHCEREDLDVRARIELVARIAEAVHYAHENGIVHRDLKPDNVLVDSKGAPRVLDFGIARATSSATLSTIVTEEGRLVGTLAYMAPEQLGGSSDEVTAASDVYALGVLAFELLVGRLPRQVADLSLSQAVAVLATTDVPRAGELARELRGDVDTILGRALETSPERRYPTAAALAADLRRHLDDRPILARPPTRTYLAAKFARRHRGLVGGTLATLATLVTGTLVALSLAKEAGEQRDLASAGETRAVNGVLQSARLLGSAGEERDALSQLRLVRGEDRGLAWWLVERSLPLIVDAPAGRWRFTDDEHMVGASDGGLLLYSLTEQRVVSEHFRELGLYAVSSATPGGIASAVSFNDGQRHAEVFLLDLQREEVLLRGPAVLAEGTLRVPAGQVDAGRPKEYRYVREPESSDDGATLLWYPSPDVAQVRVDGDVVRTVRNLHAAERVHLGPDGRLLVVNRLDEVTCLDVASGELLFRHSIRDPLGAVARPFRGGIVLHSAYEPVGWAGPKRWRRFALGAGAGVLSPTDAFAGGFRSPEDGKQVWTFPSRDGRFVASSIQGGAAPGAIVGNMVVAPPPSFAALGTREGHPGWWIEFTGRHGSGPYVAPSGQRLAVVNGWEQPRIVELDPRANDPAFEPHCLTLRGHADPAGNAGRGWIYNVAVSNDGSLIASAAPEDPLVRLWDARTGEAIGTLERTCGARDWANPGSWEALLAFSPDDERLLMTTPFGAVGLCVVGWELATGEATLHRGGAPLEAVHLTALDLFVDALGPGPRQRLGQRTQMLGDRALAVFTPPAPGSNGMPPPSPGERWSYAPGIEGNATGLSIHPHLPLAATVQAVNLGVARTGLLTVVDTRSGEVLLRRELRHQPWCVAYSPRGDVLALGTDEGNVVLYETELHTQQLVWRAHEDYVYSLAWTPDGGRLVTVSGDETVRVWGTRPRVAERLEVEEWLALRAEAASAEGLPRSSELPEGLPRQAARVERIRRAHAP